MFRTGLASTVLLFLSLGTAPAADDTVAAEMKALKGNWHVLYVEMDGFKNPSAEQNIRLRIEGDTMTYEVGGRPTMRGTFTVAPSNKPKHLDYTPVDGPLKGSVLRYVYEVKDGRLYLAGYDGFRATRERPKKIETESAPGVSTAILVPAERIRPDIVKRGAQREPAMPPGAEEAMIQMARFFDAIEQKKPELVMECVEVPWLEGETLLKGRDEVLGYFRRAIPEGFGYLKHGVPPVREIATLGQVRERFGPAVRRHLEDLLAADDLLLEVVPRRTAEVQPYFLLVRLKGKDGRPKVVGMTGVPRRGDAPPSKDDRRGRPQSPRPKDPT